MLAAERHWATWNAARPAEMVHVPLGVAISPFAYAASIRTGTWFPQGPQAVLGGHALDSSFVHLKLQHAGTVLDWSYRKSAADIVTGGWTARKQGEWGLRFWICVCLSSAEGWLWRYDPATGHLRALAGRTCITVVFRHLPLLVTAHDGKEALEQEFRTHGYWYLRSRAAEGRFVALRFNLEEMPHNSFAIAIASDEAEADRRAEKALREEIPADSHSDLTLAALRDILAWNTVWDPINKRPYTACSRNWDLEKFGGFGVWLTDTAINALLHAVFATDQASENLEVLLAGQTPAGNFPCLLTGNDSWLDRSQPPLLSLVVWLIHQRTGSTELLHRTYESLVRNHHWWWRNRDGNGNGILEYGSSAIGEGLYIGTKLAAKDESFMDNSPVHDEARWNPETRTLDCEDVGLNSLLVLDAEMLALIAAAIDRSSEARTHAARAEAHRRVVTHHFWDRSRKVFANRLWSGKFVRSLAPTSFFPLLAGAADRAQIAALKRHLRNPRMFGGKFGLPSVARKDQAFRDNVYWRGRIWPILNWLVWLGLKRASLEGEAQALRKKGDALFAKSWQDRHAPENFNATTGAGLDQPDTDSFYSWTALLPFMTMSGVIDFDPWRGWCLTNDGKPVHVGPLLTPAGLLSIRVKGGWLALLQGSAPIFETDMLGRISGLTIGQDHIGFTLPPRLRKRSSVRLSRQIVSATQDGAPLSVAQEESGSSFILLATEADEETVEIACA